MFFNMRNEFFLIIAISLADANAICKIDVPSF